MPRLPKVGPTNDCRQLNQQAPASVWVREMSYLDTVGEEMLEGYRDGLADERDALPDSLTNRSAAYINGWLNGRDDRLQLPRETAQQSRVKAAAIKRYAEQGLYSLPNPSNPTPITGSSQRNGKP